MTISFFDFLGQLVSNPILLVTTVLVLAVILVNGWTDAPNAIATCVSTRSMSANKAIMMAAVFNFIGVFVMTKINASVADTIYKIADFSGNTHDALVALCAAMVAIVVWATVASYFGIPTSESHALIAGISGAAIALHGSFSGINADAWMKVIYGLVLSTFLGFFMGYFVVKLVELLFKWFDKRKTARFFGGAQIASGAAMAFMHGAQDGQKFMGVFMIGVLLANGQDTSVSTSLPIWLMIICSLTMGLGTSIGGYRIIKAVGMDMVKLEKYQGFAADSAAASCLLISSLTGIPVSTTHTKTTAIMGVGAAKGISRVNWGVVKDMVLTWVLTFPGCGLIAYFMTKLFIVIF